MPIRNRRFAKLPAKVHRTVICLQREINISGLGCIKTDALDLIHLFVAFGKPVTQLVRRFFNSLQFIGIKIGVAIKMTMQINLSKPCTNGAMFESQLIDLFDHNRQKRNRRICVRQFRSNKVARNVWQMVLFGRNHVLYPGSECFMHYRSGPMDTYGGCRRM